MSKLLGDNSRAFAGAIAVHVLLVIVLVVGLSWHSAPPPAPGKVDVIEAVVMDEAKINTELEKLQREEQRKRQQEQERKQRLTKEAEQAKQKRLAEERRIKELKQIQAEERRKKDQQARRLAEIKKEQQAEQKRLADLEKKRQQEQQRLAELEAKSKLEAENRRKAEEDRQRQEAERALQEQLAAEQSRLEAERDERLRSLRDQYIAAIRQKVNRHWLRPTNATSGLSCRVLVNQIPGGEVVNVNVTSCSGDAVFRRSVEAAVYKASPLPPPPDPALFDREIVFIFNPTD